mmetsp:Transcript_89726/g.155302  ORF Transcript_89726/g.155302 Transcript_89726/m.155302 type:complete len:229 (-) Transcript_89726:887-1573(-)
MVSAAAGFHGAGRPCPLPAPMEAPGILPFRPASAPCVSPPQGPRRRSPTLRPPGMPESPGPGLPRFSMGPAPSQRSRGWPYVGASPVPAISSAPGKGMPSMPPKFCRPPPRPDGFLLPSGMPLSMPRRSVPPERCICGPSCCIAWFRMAPAVEPLNFCMPIPRDGPSDLDGPRWLFARKSRGPGMRCSPLFSESSAQFIFVAGTRSMGLRSSGDAGYGGGDILASLPP